MTRADTTPHAAYNLTRSGPRARPTRNHQLSVKTINPATRRIAQSRPRSGTGVLLFNKPFGVLCQFSGDGTRPTLKDYIDVPDVYPAGRLDTDSEGLVVLTANGALQTRIADPKHKLEKIYWVQVDGTPDASQFAALEHGIELADGMTRPARAHSICEPAGLWPRDPPIRVRKLLPTAWLELTISEGRNRQVRRMTAAVGLPTLRLIRRSVGPWTIDGLAPGTWRSLNEGTGVL
jgi:23S rRNA pseudouridine2457 synthase